MKKALSVLLVAAALFGFYGSAVTVNDLLACKDYWEEAGEKSTADMNKLEDGLNQLKDNEQAYLDGIQQVADGEVALADGEAQYAQGLKDYAAAPGKLAAGRAAVASGTKELAEGKSQLDEGRKTLDKLESNVEQLRTNFNTWETGWKKANTPNKELKHPVTGDSLTPVQAFQLEDSLGRIRSANVDDADVAMVKGAAAKKLKDTLDEKAAAFGGSAGVCAQIGESDISADNIDTVFTKLVGACTPAKMPNPNYDPDDPTTGPQYVDNPFHAFLEMVNAGKKDYEDSLASLEDLKKLEPGRDQLTSYFMQLINTITKNGTDTDMVKALGGADALSQVQQGLSQYASDGVWDAVVNGLFEKADKLIASKEKEYKQGLKKYNAGKAKLAAGKRTLAKGEADYAAAPGKLADAEQQLADGRKQLEDGKAQLAQYEDGEQQIRDGLATLFNTDADLDLVSIADRLNGDGDFDNGDNHLEIEEGLNAVEVGRGYQAEDGVLITNEIMGRAVATGGLLAAAVLAVLAAILSFLKKYKGAGVFAILAAAAGAFGAFYGPAQGTYFSEIAGSTIGTTTWVAAGVLGAVALVHAIAHFAAKKEA